MYVATEREEIIGRDGGEEPLNQLASFHRSLKTRTSVGHHAQHRLLVEPALVFADDRNDRGIRARRALRVQDLEYIARLPLAFPAPLGGPKREPVETRVHDLAHEHGPRRIRHTECVADIAAEVQPFRDHGFESARL